MYFRRLSLAAVAGLSLVACSATDTAPDPDQLPAASWVLSTANGQPAPALVFEKVWPDNGERSQLYVTADTIEVTSAGRYVQHAQILGYSNGVLVNRVNYADHGVVTRSGATLHFVSNYLGNVTFDAELTAANSLSTMQDLLNEGAPAQYVLRVP